MPTTRHVGLVHRIDKDTSGLTGYRQRHRMPKRNLGVQFFNKTTKRTDTAHWYGALSIRMKVRIVGSIARNPKDRMQMAVMRRSYRKGNMPSPTTACWRRLGLCHTWWNACLKPDVPIRYVCT